MHLQLAQARHLEELMIWFGEAESCRLWGGPYLRFPFNRQSFSEDIGWGRILSFAGTDEQDQLFGFGQVYRKHDYVHLARLAIAPSRRGQGFGKQLIQALMVQGQRHFGLHAYSLYVYKHNQPALGCYARMGFVITEAPEDTRAGRECWYMTMIAK